MAYNKKTNENAQAKPKKKKMGAQQRRRLKAAAEAAAVGAATAATDAADAAAAGAAAAHDRITAETEWQIGRREAAADRAVGGDGKVKKKKNKRDVSAISGEKRKAEGEADAIQDWITGDSQRKRVNKRKKAEEDLKKPEVKVERGPAQPGDGLTVFVGGIPFAATKEMVTEFFNGCGEVVDVRIPKADADGYAKGYCHVSFSDASGATAACAKDGEHMVQTHAIVTEWPALSPCDRLRVPPRWINLTAAVCCRALAT